MPSTFVAFKTTSAPISFARSAAANERLGDLGHRDGALDAGGDAVLFQRVLQGEGVDDGGQHSHVIAGCPFDAPLASGQAAENVPSADHDDDLDAKLAHFADLTGHVVNGLRANTDTRFASQRLATELEQNAGIPGFG